MVDQLDGARYGKDPNPWDEESRDFGGTTGKGGAFRMLR